MPRLLPKRATRSRCTRQQVERAGRRQVPHRQPAGGERTEAAVELGQAQIDAVAHRARETPRERDVREDAGRRHLLGPRRPGADVAEQVATCAR